MLYVTTVFIICITCEQWSEMREKRKGKIVLPSVLHPSPPGCVKREDP